MRRTYDLKIEEVENYLNTIFELRGRIIDKDFKIAMLEFELALEKQLMTAFKKYYLPQLSVN